jgi:hypothetical protein
MPQFPHDDFSKDYLTELLSRIGKATPSSPIKAETREADLWFEINPKLQAAKRQQLGLLGQLLTRNALIEVFRNPATPFEIKSCEAKLTGREAELRNQTKRGGSKALTEEQLPELWIIVPTASDSLREGLGTVVTNTAGIYRFPVLRRTGLIVVHQLVKDDSTLWLRILGREGNQERAIDEFTQHPQPTELHASIEELLADYRAKLANRKQLTNNDKELFMNLSAAYLKQQQNWKQEGRQEGRQEGDQISTQRIAINLLKENMPIDLIARTTGLSIDQINQLRP